MFKLNTISMIEHGDYLFEDAVASADTFNGALGTVTDGKFSVAADASKAIMQVEVGDDAGMPTYKIAKDSHVRVIDFTKIDGKMVEIYGDQLPEELSKGTKLKSDETGALIVGTDAPYFEVDRIIGNKLGVVAKVVAK